MTEGFTDALLLPTLIREVTGESRLPYSVVPQFSRVSSDEIPNFDLMAARLVLLADGDQGGDDAEENLSRHGVLPEQIVFLGGKGSGLSLEDLVDPEVYLAAVNAELSAQVAGLEFPTEDLPETGRSRTVRDWAAKQLGADGSNVRVSKAAVAQRILDQRKNRDLIDPERRDELAELHKNIQAILEEATHRLVEKRGRSASPRAPSAKAG